MSSARVVHFITHPDVLIDPTVAVTDWPLSPRGLQRMVVALSRPWVDGVGAVWCSMERKARDGAALLAGRLGLPATELAGLGENARSATGYLPGPEFVSVADQFFAQPERSVRGWERAIDAQARIIEAVDQVLAAASKLEGDVAIMSHGAVGALLLSHLRGCAIGREHDQPLGDGGNRLVFAAASRRLSHGWRPIDS